MGKKQQPANQELFPEYLTNIQRKLIQSSHNIIMNDPEDIAFQHSIFCQTNLPYRNPGDSLRLWRRKQGKIILEIDAGRIVNPVTDDFTNMGLPYGVKARLIITHLNSQALRNNSSIIDVESTLTAFVKSLGIDANGRDINTIKDQLSRLSAASIRLGFFEEKHAVQVNTRFIKAFDLWLEKTDEQKVLWPSHLQLSEDYFHSLMQHAVPLDERAVRALSHSALGIDIYTWLAQRLHRVKKGCHQFISWIALKDQFGYDYNRLRAFREVFTKTLTKVHSQYPDAIFHTDEQGMTLFHSTPPIRSKTLIIP
jgi:hypothetical protein